MSRPQYVKRRQQLLQTFFINEVSQQYNQGSSLAVRRDEFKRVRIRRLDHLGLDCVQRLERRFNVIVSATGRQVTLDPASENDQARVVTGAGRGGKERERRMHC